MLLTSDQVGLYPASTHQMVPPGLLLIYLLIYTGTVLSWLSLAWMINPAGRIVASDFDHRSTTSHLSIHHISSFSSHVDVFHLFIVLQTGLLYWQCTWPVSSWPRLQSKPAVLLSELWRWLLGKVLGHKKRRWAGEGSVRPFSLVCNLISELTVKVCLFASSWLWMWHFYHCTTGLCNSRSAVLNAVIHVIYNSVNFSIFQDLESPWKATRLTNQFSLCQVLHTLPLQLLAKCLFSS